MSMQPVAIGGPGAFGKGASKMSRYIDTHCNIRQNESIKEDTYTITGKDIFSGTKVSIVVPGHALFKFRQGAMMQDAFPMLTKEQREFLISGMYDSFPEDDDEG